MDQSGIRIEAALSADSYRAIIESVRDGIYLVDRHRRILFWNRGAERISGYRHQEVAGRSCADQILTHTDRTGCELCKHACPLAQTMLDGLDREADVFLHHREGHRVPVRVKAAAVRDAQGRILGAVETFYENAALFRAEQTIEALRKVALVDTVTGLPNRQGTESKLKAMVTETASTGRSLGFFFADVDDFTEVNDRYGCDMGDKVLRMAGQTLAHAMRFVDVVGRWGGAKFAGVLPDVDQADLVQLAERGKTLVRDSYLTTSAGMMRVTLSLGLVLALPSDSADDIISKANTALRLSRSGGNNRWTLYKNAAAA